MMLGPDAVDVQHDWELFRDIEYINTRKHQKHVVIGIISNRI